MNLLFFTWDGPGGNYHESLFMPIFARSRQDGEAVHLLQYTWDANGRTASIREAAERLGMPFTARPVWRRPQTAATAAMIARGALEVAGYARRQRIDVLMPRSIIPAGMALLARRFLPRVRLLYDADGLMADERADFGGWSREGRPYRTLRAIEAAAVRRADVVITRTGRAKRILAERAGLAAADKIVVVANGKDERVFQPGSPADRAATRQDLGLSDSAPLVVYAGSLGPQYYPHRMLRFFNSVQRRRQDARLVILTGTPAAAREVARENGCDESAVDVRSIPSGDVPRYLAAADLGLAFRAATLSQQAVAPIKVGEYLLCGLPVLGTSGIGDLDDQLDAGAGRLLDRLDDAALEDAAAWFLQDVLPARDKYRDACRACGLAHFSLDRSAARYREAFDRLAAAP